jgi:phosphoribosylanthranilate isomerase
MPLKTFVKVGGITNLSDARYCAGMGVDLLGFAVLEGQNNHIDLKLYQEIRGWVAGPKVVAEVYGLRNAGDLSSIIQHYAPDFIECSLKEFETLYSASTLPFIVHLQPEDFNQLQNTLHTIAYWVIDDQAANSIPAGDRFPLPVLLKLNTSQNVSEKLAQYPIHGVVLNGSSEIRPGYKNYDDLAKVLEELDEY